MKKFFLITVCVMLTIVAFGQPPYVTVQNIPCYDEKAGGQDSYVKERCVFPLIKSCILIRKLLIALRCGVAAVFFAKKNTVSLLHKNF
jgi:hypothetical protein